MSSRSPWRWCGAGQRWRRWSVGSHPCPGGPRIRRCPPWLPHTPAPAAVPAGVAWCCCHETWPSSCTPGPASQGSLRERNPRGSRSGKGTSPLGKPRSLSAGCEVKRRGRTTLSEWLGSFIGVLAGIVRGGCPAPSAARALKIGAALQKSHSAAFAGMLPLPSLSEATP